uniref:Uncharacterized protein n=1 Tax=Panagrellus redivivus TaxID=6233 RepID=A0A7E4VXJ9_PANRE
MIDIEITSTNFPPNAEVNFPAEVSFLAPKATTTTTTTTTTEVPTSTVPEDVPEEAEEDVEESTAAVVKASTGTSTALVVLAIAVFAIISIIASAGGFIFSNRMKIKTWYSDRKNKGNSTKKDTGCSTGAEDQQDGNQSIKPTGTDQTTMSPSVHQKNCPTEAI